MSLASAAPKSPPAAEAAAPWMPAPPLEADPATVKIGQTLTTVHGPQVVRAIAKETHVGAYHLVTPSGAYYVDGVVASTYIAHVPLGVGAEGAGRPGGAAPHGRWRPHPSGCPTSPTPRRRPAPRRG